MKKLLLPLLSSAALLSSHGIFASEVQLVAPAADSIVVPIAEPAPEKAGVQEIAPVIIDQDITQDKIRVEGALGSVKFVKSESTSEPKPDTENAELYMIIHNDNDKPVTLIDFNAAGIAAGAVIHKKEGTSMTIPSKGHIVLEAGKTYIELLNISGTQKEKFVSGGMVYGMQLLFQETGPKDIEVTIKN